MTSTGSLQLINSCFQPEVKDLRLIIGAGNIPNLLVDGLPVKRFIRVAVLGDAERGEFQLKVPTDNCTMERLTIDYPVAKNQWENQLRNTYVKQTMKETRGATATYFGYCYLKVTPGHHVISQHPTEALGVPGSENYVPFPVTVKF
jgi:hypothetical protein